MSGPCLTTDRPRSRQLDTTTTDPRPAFAENEDANDKDRPIGGRDFSNI
jgi:hypothetical protein